MISGFGAVEVHHNSDWSGEATVRWTDGEHDYESSIPGHLLNALSKRVAFDTLRHKLKLSVEEITFPDHLVATDIAPVEEVDGRAPLPVGPFPKDDGVTYDLIYQPLRTATRGFPIASDIPSRTPDTLAQQAASWWLAVMNEVGEDTTLSCRLWPTGRKFTKSFRETRWHICLQFGIGLGDFESLFSNALEFIKFPLVLKEAGLQVKPQGKDSYMLLKWRPSIPDEFNNYEVCSTHIDTGVDRYMRKNGWVTLRQDDKVAQWIREIKP